MQSTRDFGKQSRNYLWFTAMTVYLVREWEEIVCIISFYFFLYSVVVFQNRLIYFVFIKNVITYIMYRFLIRTCEATKELNLNTMSKHGYDVRLAQR